MSRYYTIAEAKTDGVDGGLGDTALQKAIDEVEAIFESVTNRRFDTRTLTLKFDGDDSTMLFIKAYPIISITSIHIDDVLMDSDYYEVYTDKIEIIQNYTKDIYLGTSAYSFSKGTQNIVVVGSFGYAESSATWTMIKRAIRLMTSANISGALAVETYESEKISDYAYKVATGDSDKAASVFGVEVDLIIKQLKRKISLTVI